MANELRLKSSEYYSHARYDIIDIVIAVIKTSETHEVTNSSGDADIIIRMAVASIKDNGKLIGAAISMLATEKKTHIPRKIIEFDNEVIMLKNIDLRIKEKVNNILE